MGMVGQFRKSANLLERAQYWAVHASWLDPDCFAEAQADSQLLASMVAQEAELEAVSQQLAELRYQVGHEGEVLDETQTALRLCRQAIDPAHCAECRAAASLADVILGGTR